MPGSMWYCLPNNNCWEDKWEGQHDTDTMLAIEGSLDCCPVASREKPSYEYRDSPVSAGATAWVCAFKWASLLRDFCFHLFNYFPPLFLHKCWCSAFWLTAKHTYMVLRGTIWKVGFAGQSHLSGSFVPRFAGHRSDLWTAILGVEDLSRVIVSLSPQEGFLGVFSAG